LQARLFRAGRSVIAMIRILLAATMTIALSSGIGLAQDKPATIGEETVEGGRFTLLPGGEGFVRLDRQTGQMSYCTIANERLACRLAADERDAYEREIARLEGREPAEAPAAPPALTDAEQQRQFEKAMDYAEQALRRLFATVDELRNELDRRLETR